MKYKSCFLTAAVTGSLAILLIALILFVDVAPIGPAGTSVGLSHLNRFVFDLTGVHLIWYTVTDWLGVPVLFVAFFFAGLGLFQLIKRKSLFKVDREILLLGGLYLVTAGLYVLFERAVVNLRPVILVPGAARPEASFPSSHTMMVCVILGSAAMLIGKTVKRKAPRRALRAVCFTVIGVTVVGRLIAGVHWFTDILGGILISATLLALYKGGIEKMKKNYTVRPETKDRIWRRGDTVFYKGGVTDPDYCVLRFTAESGRFYRDLKTADFTVK